MKNIGHQLRRLRHDRALSLRQVSELTGFSVSTLSRLETGKRSPHLDYLVPLARLYGVSYKIWGSQKAATRGFIADPFIAQMQPSFRSPSSRHPNKRSK
ncbi:helix-turn-helix transcriptional regulator [Corynebacterium hindlerae]|uniref:helix-turn-helix domain-containing protein n=1 Tax=Corynebacterium hindlerae TaxID=699041 RepID=UPI0030B83553